MQTKSQEMQTKSCFPHRLSGPGVPPSRAHPRARDYPHPEVIEIEKFFLENVENVVIMSKKATARMVRVEDCVFEEMMMLDVVIRVTGKERINLGVVR